MERGNTKYEILDAALTLFSTGGYEATSISQIAEHRKMINGVCK